ncbi:MAG: diacylglycerol kinase family protein [Dysgonamonadaceae bacterium]|nr:diacylglycerol kinase family protein [Dysgonamonadaceae bacterium]MDD4727238.1 diacylglycerol kinase family protein [Dysgonamonadaceae bacterium]
MIKYIKGRIKSLAHAFDGICTLIKEEHNARIYVALTIIVLLMSYLLRISKYEWIIVCSVIGFVFAFEAVNASIERLADFASNHEIHPTIKKVKDLAAAAVLFVAIVALIAGLIIFLPKLLCL